MNRVLLVGALDGTYRSMLSTAFEASGAAFSHAPTVEAMRAVPFGSQGPSLVLLTSTPELLSQCAWLQQQPGGHRIVAFVETANTEALLAPYRAGVDDVLVGEHLPTLRKHISAIATCPRRPAAPQTSKVAAVCHQDPTQRQLIAHAMATGGWSPIIIEDPATLDEHTVPGLHLIVTDGYRELPETLDRIPRVRIGAPKRGMGGLERTCDANNMVETVPYYARALTERPDVNRRLAARLIFETVCTFQALGTGQLGHGVIANISRNGLFVRTGNPPLPGTMVLIQTETSAAGGDVNLRGMISWSCSLEEAANGKGIPGFGVHIIAELSASPDIERFRIGYETQHQALQAATRPEGTEPEDRGKASLLIADDDARLLRVYTRIFERAGYAVTSAADGDLAVRAFRNGRFDAVLTDIDMPGLTGLELLRAIREIDADVPVLIATGGPSTETAIEALERGALKYLVKPVPTSSLLKAVEQAVDIGRLTQIRHEAVSLLSGVLSERLSSQADIEDTFNRAMDQLYLLYQPIVSMSQQKVYGYEALVRSRELAMPHPGAIINAAEALDKLHVLGRKIRKLAPQPLGDRSEYLFVNLHPLDLFDDQLLTGPLRHISTQVVLELTERASLEGLPGIRKRVDALRMAGYRIAVDDLGAGYAGLNSFAQLQPDVVKIDMSLVRDVHLMPTKQRLIRSICEICTDLNITLVTEGVETVEERDTLIGLGCDLLQGYLFARPAPPFIEPNWPK